MVWIPLPLLLVATVYDLKCREVPDWVSVLLLGWAVAATAFGLSDVSWLSLLGGLGVAFGLGLLVFAGEGLGGADVKLLAALGAIVGHEAIWPLLFWVALAGGVLALVAKFRGKKDLAYVPAIALGLLLFLLRQEFGHALHF